MISSVVKNVVLPFAKQYWRELLVVFCLSALFIKNHIDYARLEQAYAVSEESLKNQLSNLHELHAEELLRRDEALKEYKDAVESAREDYERGLEQLEEDSNQQREAIVSEIIVREQLTENRDELAVKIETQLGFNYVP